MPVSFEARALTPRRGVAPITPTAAPASAPAAQYAAVEVFKACSNCGKDVLAANLLMHEAHCSRHFKRCQHCGVLLESTAIPDHVDEMRGTLSVLVAAVEAGDASRVRVALDHGSEEVLSWRDERGASLLHLAAAIARDNWAMHALVADMLRAGADVNSSDQYGWTVLHAAARGGSAAVIAPLITAGADVHARNPLGSTPLEVAVGEEVRVALLSAGAELPGSQGSSRANSRASSSHSRRPSVEPPPQSATPCQHAVADSLSHLALSDTQVHNAAVDNHPVRRLDEGRPLSSSRHAQRLRAMVQTPQPLT